MPESANPLNWGVRRRLEFIEFRVFWEGSVNRSDIMRMFGVSVPQASKDMSLYQEIAPENLIYDKRAKRYIAGARFSPVFSELESHTYLNRLRSLGEGLTPQDESWISFFPALDVAAMPYRNVDATVLRAVLASMREEHSIEVLYQSMSSGRSEPIWRRITPHALGHDGSRWHARSFCHLDASFKDFLLPRMLSVRAAEEPGAPAHLDWAWHEIFQLWIAPHPSLSPSQQSVVAQDYGMADGKCSIPVRYAMLFYVAKRLGLLSEPAEVDPRRQHIVALNRDEMQLALARAESQLSTRP